MGKIIPTAQGVQALSAPSFMESDHKNSNELLKQYVVPPRLKVVQPTSRKPFSDLFKPGDLVAVPMMQKIAEFNGGKEPAFYFVPLFFWPEWVCWNPLETKGNLRSVRDRSLDPRSILAAKAKDENRRGSEICPECPEKDGKKLYLKYLEHLNYMLMPLAPSSFADMPICITFASGEHRAGTNFSSLITMRRAPLYGCQFEAVVRERENQKGRWYGIDIDSPREGSNVEPFVKSEESYNAYKSIWAEFKTAYDDKAIQVDYEDTESDIEAPKDSKDF